ncbi:MAG: hypothetical protein HFI67_11820 [Lachnospiraceae bacterium]|nr:hypothetical protein [Lachnospiraceae bacterium]
MYREMKVEEALEEYLKGRNVVLMDIIQMPDEAVQYQGTELKDVFEGSVLLVDLPDGHDKEKTSLPVKGSPPSTGKKKWFLNATDKELVRERYLAGMEMEDISKKLNLSLTSISRYVDEEVSDKNIQGYTHFSILLNADM